MTILSEQESKQTAKSSNKSHTHPAGAARGRSSTPNLRLLGAATGGHCIVDGAVGGKTSPPPAASRSFALEERFRLIRKDLSPHHHLQLMVFHPQTHQHL